MSRQVVVGKEVFSLSHLKVFRREEIEKFMGDVTGDLTFLSENTVVVFSPIRLEVSFCGEKHLLSPGLTHVRGTHLEIAGGVYLPAFLDEEYLEYLLFDLPRELDKKRVPIVVEDSHKRFTKWVREGLMYSYDILSRIAKVYRVPIIVYGDRETENMWSYVKTFACEKVDGRGKCFVDGKPCGESDVASY